VYKNQRSSCFATPADGGGPARWPSSSTAASFTAGLFFKPIGGSAQSLGAMLTSLTTDRSALVALYTATGGEHWWQQGSPPMGTNWTSNVSVCMWNGVTSADALREQEASSVVTASSLSFCGHPSVSWHGPPSSLRTP
jgi:hypothetical protein